MIKIRVYKPRIPAPNAKLIKESKSGYKAESCVIALEIRAVKTMKKKDSTRIDTKQIIVEDTESVVKLESD